MKVTRLVQRRGETVLKSARVVTQGAPLSQTTVVRTVHGTATSGNRVSIKPRRCARGATRPGFRGRPAPRVCRPQIPEEPTTTTPLST